MVKNSIHELDSCRRRLYDHSSTAETSPSTTRQHNHCKAQQYTPLAQQTTPTTPRFSHSRKQRQRRSQAKAQQTDIANTISWERQQLNIKLNNIVTTAKQRTHRRFGFVPTLSTSVHKNARTVLGHTHPQDYFPLVQNLTFHDHMSTHKLPPTANQLLGLGLKFIPTPRINITVPTLEQTLERFERDLGLKIFFAGEDSSSSYDPKQLRGKSLWRAPLPPTEIDNRLQQFNQNMERLFHPCHTTPNLSPLQYTTLQQIKRNPNITILSADKGLGPVGVDTKQYIEWGLKHLMDHTTYTILTEEQANTNCENLYHTIYQWTCKHRKLLDDDTTRYIRDHVEKARKDPLGYFYLLAKLHKSPVSTRPVCSDCASLPHSVGKWVDRQLQPIVRDQKTYFQDSFELKQLLNDLDTLPLNACLFTYDAISMYTNINTEECLQRLTTFLTEPATQDKYPHLHPLAVIDALQIVMNNNRMRFGNLIAHQHKGIAMGMAPAPSIANLFVAIYEEAHITTFPTTSLHFLRRFIDDGFGIWLRNSDPQQDDLHWIQFKTIVNSMGLTWEFSTRSSKVTFMDLNVHLHNGRIQTSLYAKPMALHLYIPPSSCHAPGIITGLIHGHFYRIFQLCSNKNDVEREIYLFFNRLLLRGHSLCDLIPLFLDAELKTKHHIATKCMQQRHRQSDPLNTTQQTQQSQQDIFFHLQYHPANPPASEIQRIWRRDMLSPPMKTPLHQLTNRDGFQIPIKKLTIAYSRAPNLGNLLSCRKLNVNIEDYTDMWQPQTNTAEHRRGETTPQAL